MSTADEMLPTFDRVFAPAPQGMGLDSVRSFWHWERGLKNIHDGGELWQVIIENQMTGRVILYHGAHPDVVFSNLNDAFNYADQRAMEFMMATWGEWDLDE